MIRITEKTKRAAVSIFSFHLCNSEKAKSMTKHLDTDVLSLGPCTADPQILDFDSLNNSHHIAQLLASPRTPRPVTASLHCLRKK